MGVRPVLHSHKEKPLAGVRKSIKIMNDFEFVLLTDGNRAYYIVYRLWSVNAVAVRKLLNAAAVDVGD